MPVYIIRDANNHILLVLRTIKPDNAIVEVNRSTENCIIIYSNNREYKLILDKPDNDKIPEEFEGVVCRTYWDNYQNSGKDKYETVYDYLIGKIKIDTVLSDLDLQQLIKKKKICAYDENILKLHANFDFLEIMKEVALSIKYNKFNIEQYLTLRIKLIYYIINGLSLNKLTSNNIDYYKCNGDGVIVYECFTMKVYGCNVTFVRQSNPTNHLHFAHDDTRVDSDLIKSKSYCGKSIHDCDLLLEDLLVFRGKAKSARNV